jgi:hypothetical protein
VFSVGSSFEKWYVGFTKKLTTIFLKVCFSVSEKQKNMRNVSKTKGKKSWVVFLFLFFLIIIIIYLFLQAFKVRFLLFTCSIYKSFLKSKGSINELNQIAQVCCGIIRALN